MLSDCVERRLRVYSTPELRAARRLEQLAASSLVVLDVEHAPGEPGTDDALPTERSIWRRMASSSTIPRAVVATSEADDATARVYDSWRTLSLEHGVISPTGSVLVSTPTDGPDLGWMPVRLTPATQLPNTEVDEFVALSHDGRRYSAVSSEEHAYWVIVGETDAPAQPPR